MKVTRVRIQGKRDAASFEIREGQLIVTWNDESVNMFGLENGYPPKGVLRHVLKILNGSVEVSDIEDIDSMLVFLED